MNPKVRAPVSIPSKGLAHWRTGAKPLSLHRKGGQTAYWSALCGSYWRRAIGHSWSASGNDENKGVLARLARHRLTGARDRDGDGAAGAAGRRSDLGWCNPVMRLYGALLRRARAGMNAQVIQKQFHGRRNPLLCTALRAIPQSPCRHNVAGRPEIPAQQEGKGYG